MSNVLSLYATCEYMVERAAKHRLAGRYDEAMALLSRAKDSFGLREDIELEMAQVYDALACEEEAARAYLRVARLNGKSKALALYELANGAAEHGDLKRASSYFQQFAAMNSDAIHPRGVALFAQQLELESKGATTMPFRRSWVRSRERHAVEKLRSGRTVAAKHALERAVALAPTAQNMTLLACCHLVREEHEEAVRYAQAAYRLAPGRMQTACVLVDALTKVGQDQAARNVLYMAALRANTIPARFMVAVESAKRGDDGLTLRLTRQILRQEPFHVQAMRLHACALTNRGRLQEASRLFGRLCGLLPEDTVVEALYRLTREGNAPRSRLVMGLDVPLEEGVSRNMALMSALYAPSEAMQGDVAEQKALCRLCDWAIHSHMVGAQGTTGALILLGALDTPQAEEVLLDALTDPQVGDGFKRAILQTLTAKHGFKPYAVDYGGQLAHMAASGMAERLAQEGNVHPQAVQRAADTLLKDFPDAAQVLLPVYIAYVEAYGVPKGRMEDACTAVLELTYHALKGHPVQVAVVARREGVTKRLCRLCMRRMMRATDTTKSSMTKEGHEP